MQTRGGSWRWSSRGCASVPKIIRFIDRPSLAVLGSMLTRRFKKGVSVTAVDGGLEFTFTEDPTPGDLTRLEVMMERLGYIMEE